MYEMIGFTKEYQEFMERLLLRAGFAVSVSENGNICFEPLGGLEDEEILAKMREYEMI